MTTPNEASLSGMGRTQLPVGWQALRLGAMVRQRRRVEALQPGTDYRLLGVRWYGQGAFLRETVTTETSEATRLQPVTAGSMIYNRLFAWKGSFGLVPPELDGTHVSGEFPLFDARSGHDIRYITYWMLQPWVWQAIEAESTGATAVSRNRWKESSLRSFVVAAPPLEAQQRIAEQLDDRTTSIRDLLDEFGSPVSTSNGTLADLLVERRGALITAAVTGQMEIP